MLSAPRTEPYLPDSGIRLVSALLKQPPRQIIEAGDPLPREAVSHRPQIAEVVEPITAEIALEQPVVVAAIGEHLRLACVVRPRRAWDRLHGGRK